MNNVVETFADKAKWAARIVARRRWLVLGVAFAVGLISAAALTKVPDRYQATATVYVDTETVLKPLMAGLTFQPDIDQQVRMLARTLISRPNVERLVNIPELQFHMPTPSDREDVVLNLMKQIMVVPTSSGNLFEITYRGDSPEHAQRVVDATVRMFVYSGVGARKRDSQDAGRFIEDQIHTYESKLVEAENRLKNFKARNFSVSGVPNQDYFTRVSTLTEEVSNLRIELQAAEQSRDSYRRELSAEEPQLPVDLLSTLADAVEAKDENRLDAEKKHLEELLTSYTEAHPEVIKSRRVIERLEAEAQERKQAQARSRGKQGPAATSPIYQRLRISLADTEAKVASLRSQLVAKHALLDQVRAVAGRVPQVEAELAQLNRDYDIIRKNYDLMVTRREAASLGVKLDESSQLTEFRVVDPARVSRSPVFPSRLHLALIAVLLSLAAGLAAAVVADLMAPTFDDASALRQFSKRPVLATVPVLITERAKRAQRLSILRFSVACSALLMVQAVWLAWVASH